MRQTSRSLVLVMVALTSCAGLRSDVKGLPPDANHVGSGEGFRYTPVTEGRMFVVRDNNVVLLRELHRNEEFRVVEPAPGEDPELFKKNVYYFLPGPVKTPK